MIALALLACGPRDPGTSPDTTAPPLSSPDAPWVLPATGSTGSGVDLGALERSLQDAIDLAPGIDPTPILDVYRDLLAGADASCPSTYVDPYSGVDYWLDTCTAGSGASFDGYGIDDDTYTYVDGVLAEVETAGGIGRIEDADGTFLDLDGFAQTVVSTVDGVTSTTLAVQGTFATNHPAANGTWIDDGIEPLVLLVHYDVPMLGTARVVAGALNGLPGAYPSVAFDEATLADPALGISDCDLEPTGAISALTPDGSWIDVVFDPAFTDEGVITTPPGTCDGCGRAWLGSSELGEVCLEFSGWL